MYLIFLYLTYLKVSTDICFLHISVKFNHSTIKQNGLKELSTKKDISPVNYKSLGVNFKAEGLASLSVELMKRKLKYLFCNTVLCITSLEVSSWGINSIFWMWSFHCSSALRILKSPLLNYIWDLLWMNCQSNFHFYDCWLFFEYWDWSSRNEWHFRGA